MGLFSSPPSPTPVNSAPVGSPLGTARGNNPADLPPPPIDPASIPVYTAPATDPAVATATAAANQQSISSLQGIAQMDSASILARYGQQMSMANANAGSPLLVR